MRRAMTLLECVLALALLSAVAGVLISWLTVSSGSLHLAGGSAGWEVAAQRALAFINEDLNTYDEEATRRRAAPPRVIVNGSELTIRTRTGAGPATARYAVDSAGVLRRSTGGTGGQALLESVASFICESDQETGVLRIELSSSLREGSSILRSYRVP